MDDFGSIFSGIGSTLWNTVKAFAPKVLDIVTDPEKLAGASSAATSGYSAVKSILGYGNTEKPVLETVADKKLSTKDSVALAMVPTKG